MPTCFFWLLPVTSEKTKFPNFFNILTIIYFDFTFSFMKLEESKTYTFYIDESGDAGTGQVRSGTESGASPYMTLGSVLARDCVEQCLKQFLTDMASELGIKTLHCGNMNHQRKVYYARSMAAQPIVCFGVISFKQTLEGYREDIGDEYWRYYHKCAQYLLERLGRFLQEHNIPKEAVRIVFEAANQIRLLQLQRFITRCQNNPVRPQTASLSRISTDNISTEKSQMRRFSVWGI